LTVIEYILNILSIKTNFYIPAGMTVNGTLSVDVPGQIAGCVNGDVLVNGRLVILKGGVINGNVKATELEISGSINGDVQCHGTMVLNNNCLVKGNIITMGIHIQKKAVIDGIVTKLDNNKARVDLNPAINEQSYTDKLKDAVSLVPTSILVKKVTDEQIRPTWF
jgi:cytoskeletal protein CcmA (bactofilin family)